MLEIILEQMTKTKVACFTMKIGVDSWLANHPNYYLDYKG